MASTLGCGFGTTFCLQMLHLIPAGPCLPPRPDAVRQGEAAAPCCAPPGASLQCVALRRSPALGPRQRCGCCPWPAGRGGGALLGHAGSHLWGAVCALHGHPRLPCLGPPALQVSTRPGAGRLHGHPLRAAGAAGTGKPPDPQQAGSLAGGWKAAWAGRAHRRLGNGRTGPSAAGCWQAARGRLRCMFCSEKRRGFGHPHVGHHDCGSCPAGRLTDPPLSSPTRLRTCSRPTLPAPAPPPPPSARRFIDDPELAYVITRARQVHDFWHVLFGCHTNAFGEVALKAVEFVQVGPSCGGCWARCSGPEAGARRWRQGLHQGCVQATVWPLGRRNLEEGVHASQPAMCTRHVPPDAAGAGVQGPTCVVQPVQAGSTP